MPSDPPDPHKRRWTVTRRRVVLLVGIGLVVLAIVAALAFALVSVFHAEEGGAASGTTASSAEGALGELSIGTSGMDSVQGSPTQISGEPFRTCEACHPDYLNKPDQSGDLVFSHKTHIENEVQCATCHGTSVGHFAAPAPMMMTCLSCHEGETAPNDCKNCHRKLEEIAPGLGDPAVHLAPDAKTRKTCAKCHDVEVWCEKCHGVEMPHPAAWRLQHGPVALEQSEVCVKCHQSTDKTFCISCHGVVMPHPAYWYSNHGDIARANQAACFRCHPRGEQFCNECHHAGFSPTPQWAGAQHGQVVGTKGAGACLACHKQESCTSCHASKGISVAP
jgi:hypothetical protein